MGNTAVWCNYACLPSHFPSNFAGATRNSVKKHSNSGRVFKKSFSLESTRSRLEPESIPDGRFDHFCGTSLCLFRFYHYWKRTTFSFSLPAFFYFFFHSAASKGARTRAEFVCKTWFLFFLLNGGTTVKGRPLLFCACVNDVDSSEIHECAIHIDGALSASPRLIFFFFFFFFFFFVKIFFFWFRCGVVAQKAPASLSETQSDKSDETGSTAAPTAGPSVWEPRRRSFVTLHQVASRCA